MNLQTAMNQANERGEFEPGSYPMDPDLVKWVDEHIAGFRKVLEQMSKDESAIKKFDEYFS